MENYLNLCSSLPKGTQYLIFERSSSVVSRQKRNYENYG